MLSYQDNTLYDIMYVDKDVPIHSSWLPFFEKQEVEREIKKISDYLVQQSDDHYEISPTIDRVFEAFVVTG